MRRLLSGYAISYNRRHRRHGHLFQNRYKSIICEEDPYLKELVRYIHLNPLRANIVENLAKLDSYRYCGHSVLMGKVKNDWQDRDYVLKWFGTKEGEAKRNYRQFVKKGIALGRCPELVGGGLIKSQGGGRQLRQCSALGCARSQMSGFWAAGNLLSSLSSNQIRQEKSSLPFMSVYNMPFHMLKKSVTKKMSALRH